MCQMVGRMDKTTFNAQCLNVVVLCQVSVFSVFRCFGVLMFFNHESGGLRIVYGNEITWDQQ